jgi:hypothetical protein
MDGGHGNELRGIAVTREVMKRLLGGDRSWRQFRCG